MKKIALVGAGVRARSMFVRPFTTELKDHVELVGIYDSNPVRARVMSEEFGPIPVYDDFQQMLDIARPDLIVVASSDDTHHTYIIKGMEAGFDIVSEKPMTIDKEKCKAILEAEQRTGRKLTVTFNLRFAPYFARIKQLLMEGAVGKVHHVALEWFLDRRHGADYFRRWHGQMERSGGLLVHKSTHHFDIVNWFLDSHPKQVYAYGDLAFYGPNRVERGERCMTCDYKSTCNVYYDVTKNEVHTRYYVQAEKEDGYIRDRCVFGDHINIYDTMSVNVKYESGALLTYSLVSYSPYEGWRATITGSEGRMEIGSFKRGDSKGDTELIRILKPSGETMEYHMPILLDGHGGGDEKLRKMIFGGSDAEDPLGQQAGSLAGAMSMLIGAAANESIASGKQMFIADLLTPSTI